ncbi:hypothetical protein J1TS1_17430 [Shouchella clausii]|uniref:hypothetical protein n=1 Tax=Shouchella clausii TaxID=79880 RepID=UPI001B01CE10|nr:hypothetical protein [Shouchella clausii]GIN07598.1 hypothetical protein J1TS1_17430 [Shouchella clausii]
MFDWLKNVNENNEGYLVEENNGGQEELTIEKTIIVENAQHTLITDFFLHLHKSNTSISHIPIADKTTKDIIEKQIVPFFSECKLVRREDNSSIVEYMISKPIVAPKYENKVLESLNLQTSPSLFISKEFIVDSSKIEKINDLSLKGLIEFLRKCYQKEGFTIAVLLRFEDSLKENLAVRFFSGVCNELRLATNRQNVIYLDMYF